MQKNINDELVLSNDLFPSPPNKTVCSNSSLYRVCSDWCTLHGFRLRQY